MSHLTNSAGNTKRDVMRFLRENGYRPNVSNVERVQREVSRTQSENERVEKRHREVERETGRPATVDAKGDVVARVKARVKQDIARRQR